MCLNQRASLSALHQPGVLCQLGINFLPKTSLLPGVFQCFLFSPRQIHLPAVSSTQGLALPWALLCGRGVPSPWPWPQDPTGTICSHPPSPGQVLGHRHGPAWLRRELRADEGSRGRLGGIRLPQTVLWRVFICTGRSWDLLLYVLQSQLHCGWHLNPPRALLAALPPPTGTAHSSLDVELKQSLCFDKIIVSTLLMYLRRRSVGQTPAASAATSRGFTRCGRILWFIAWLRPG